MSIKHINRRKKWKEKSHDEISTIENIKACHNCFATVRVTDLIDIVALLIGMSIHNHNHIVPYPKIRLESVRQFNYPPNTLLLLLLLLYRSVLLIVRHIFFIYLTFFLIRVGVCIWLSPPIANWSNLIAPRPIVYLSPSIYMIHLIRLCDCGSFYLHSNRSKWTVHHWLIETDVKLSTNNYLHMLMHLVRNYLEIFFFLFLFFSFLFLLVLNRL